MFAYNSDLTLNDANYKISLCLTLVSLYAVYSDAGAWMRILSHCHHQSIFYETTGYKVPAV